MYIVGIGISYCAVEIFCPSLPAMILLLAAQICSPVPPLVQTQPHSSSSPDNSVES